MSAVDSSPCPCVICTSHPPGRDASIVADVREYGWCALRVAGNVEFAYTIGLWHTFRWPEVVMFGLHGDHMQHWLNTCVDVGRDRGWPSDGEEFLGVMEGVPTQLRPVDDSWHEALFGTAWRFYRGTQVPVRQLVWPDTNGVWPWLDGATASSRSRQAFAWLPVDQHPPGRWRLIAEMDGDFPFDGGPDQYALTTRAVLDGTRTPARIVHHDGLDILDDRGYAADDLCLAFLGDIVRPHPGVRAMAGLRDGQVAVAGPGGMWSVDELSADEGIASESAREAARNR